MTRLERLREMRAWLDEEIAAEERRNISRVDPESAAIIVRAAALYGVPSEAVLTRKRGAEVTKARHAAAWLMRRGGMSFPQVARVFGMDHTTIIHACHKIDRSPSVRALLIGLEVAA